MSYIRNRRDGSTCGVSTEFDNGCGGCSRKKEKYDNGCRCNSTDGKKRRRRSSKRSKKRSSKRRSRRRSRRSRK